MTEICLPLPPSAGIKGHHHQLGHYIAYVYVCVWVLVLGVGGRAHIEARREPTGVAPP